MHLGGEQIRYLGQYDRHTNSSTTLHCVSQFQLCSHSALLQISHMEHFCIVIWHVIANSVCKFVSHERNVLFWVVCSVFELLPYHY